MIPSKTISLHQPRRVGRLAGAATLLVASALVTHLPRAVRADTPTPPPATQWSYRGSVAPRAADGTFGEAEKTFDLLLVSAPAEREPRLYWLLDETGRGAWPWPERFGHWRDPSQIVFDADAGGPALFYDRQDAASIIPLAGFWLPFPEPAAVGAGFEQGSLRLEFESQTDLDGRPAWQLVGTNRLGFNRRVWRDRDTPLVLGCQQRVFMGRGEEYQLDLRLAAETALEAPRAQTIAETFEALLAMRDALGRTARSEDRELTTKQLATIAERLPEIARLSAEGPLASLVRAAQGDLEAQTGRAHEVSQLVAQQEGRTLSEFSAEQLEGGQLGIGALRNRVTVLHFWDYRDEPLREPYGQVGYLEFLHHRRQDAGVQVFGVAVNGRLGEADARPAAVRSVRKLREFMNLTYPQLLDSGSLVSAFGDPRLVGGQLPLFVVIGPDLKIAHYRVGPYVVDRDQGLSELDAAVGAALGK